MKTDICVIKYTHPDKRFTHVLEISNNISLPLNDKAANEVIENLHLSIQETFDKKDGSKEELYY